MARVYNTGFETGSAGQFFSSSFVGFDPGRGPWSTYSLKIGSSAGATAQLLGTYSEFYAGWAFKLDVTVNNNGLTFDSDNSANQVQVLTDGANRLQVKRNGTVLATGTTSLAPNIWYYVECYFLINASTGKYQVRLNGVDEIALVTGANTKGDAGSGVVKFVNFTHNGGNAWYDDFYVNDTTDTINNSFDGDIRVQAFVPNAAGDVTGLTRGGTDSGSNWGQVDEIPPNDATDFVFATNTTSYDLYNIPNTSALASVQGVMLWARAQKSDAGVANLALGVKYDSDGNGTADTESWGPDQALSVSWTYLSRMLGRDPGAGAWTPAKVDALQVGVKSR